MTRLEKQHKLANAIREYRGLYHAQSKAWIHAPKPDKLLRVKHWLAELDLDVAARVEEINNFKSLTAFHDWMRAIDEPVVIGA
jgi:hypothetical protein